MVPFDAVPHTRLALFEAPGAHGDWDRRLEAVRINGCSMYQVQRGVLLWPYKLGVKWRIRNLGSSILRIDALRRLSTKADAFGASPRMLAGSGSIHKPYVLRTPCLHAKHCWIPDSRCGGLGYRGLDWWP